MHWGQTWREPEVEGVVWEDAWGGGLEERLGGKPEARPAEDARRMRTTRDCKIRERPWGALGRPRGLGSEKAPGGARAGPGAGSGLAPEKPRASRGGSGVPRVGTGRFLRRHRGRAPRRPQAGARLAPGRAPGRGARGSTGGAPGRPSRGSRGAPGGPRGDSGRRPKIVSKSIGVNGN